MLLSPSVVSRRTGYVTDRQTDRWTDTVRQTDPHEKVRSLVVVDAALVWGGFTCRNNASVSLCSFTAYGLSAVSCCCCVVVARGFLSPELTALLVMVVAVGVRRLGGDCVLERGRVGDRDTCLVVQSQFTVLLIVLGNS